MNILYCRNFQDGNRYNQFIFEVSIPTEMEGGRTIEIATPQLAVEDPNLLANNSRERGRSVTDVAMGGLEHVEGGIPNVTEENFQQEVLGAPGLVVVDFYADWCGPCRRMGEIMESAVNDIPEGAQIKKLDIEANRSIANQYNPEGIIPAMIFFKNGQEVSRFTGVQEREEFIANVERISRESPETSMLRTRLDSARSRANALNINTRLLLADIERDAENATEDGERVLAQTACMRLEAVVQSETDARNIVIEKSRDFINSPALVRMIEIMPDHPFVLVGIADHIALPNPIAAKWSDVLNAINALPQGTTEQTLFERRFQNLLQIAGNLSVDISTYPTHFESQEDQRTAYRDLEGKLADEILAAGRVLTRDMDYFRNEISRGERSNMNFYDLMTSPEVRAQVATKYGLAQTSPWSSIARTIEAATAPATHIDASFPTITHNL